MSTKHTQGPWKVERSDSHDHICESGGRIIARVSRVVPADAHLISATPELLEALIKCEAKIGGSQDLHDLVRNVIAKATGGEE